MAQAEIEEVIPVSKKKLFEVITRYDEYPQFIHSVRGVQVERKAPGRARVHYQVSLIKDVRYTLDHEEDFEKGELHWQLVDSDFFRKNEGRWKLTAEGPSQTRARYVLDVEFKIPVPGLILKKLVGGSLPQMMRDFSKRAQGED